MSTRTAAYVYCLVESPRRPSVARAPAGLPGATGPEIVEISERLWAVAARVPLDVYGTVALAARLTDISWVADAAVAHDAVVEHFAAPKAAAVVPMKLFTMFSTLDRAVADLRARRREVRSVLSRIRGCQEWGLRVTMRSAAVRHPATSAPARATTGTAFLAARKRAIDDAKSRLIEAADAAEDAYETLEKLSRAADRREAPREAEAPPLVDAAFLVPLAKKARFRAAAVRAAAACRQAGADLVLTGPWPAYTFVQTRA
jgi:hypothetical protein